MSDPKNKWNQPAAPPPPMFFGKKERDLVKQVNDELAERVIGQPIAYYPISIEESNFNDTYGEAIEKVALPPIRVYAYVEVANEQAHERYGYEYHSNLTVNFHRKRLVDDQNLFVRVGDFVQYGDQFYEIVRTYNDTRYYFGQVEHKFQITAECIRARAGTFQVMPAVDRPDDKTPSTADTSSPAPRPAPYPPLAATYITVTADTKLPNERVLTAGTGITLVDSGPNGNLTINAAGANADGIDGAIQLQDGDGVFAGNSNLVFLTGSSRLGIGISAPTHELTVIGDISASSNVYIAGDLHLQGTALGASPFKISGSIDIVNASGDVIASLGSSSYGSDTISASLGVINTLSASTLVSASYFYGDGSNLTNVGSGQASGQGPVGSLQFMTGSGGISGSATILYNSGSNHLTINAGLIHNRTAVSTAYTASVGDYILGITAVPVSIEFDASSFSSGQVVVVKDETGAASASDLITLAASASQTIDGAPTVSLESPYASVLLYTNGSNWFVY